MTPVVFLIAGLIFVATAATYAEATTMYPEAGGSSSFARHAFNEFWSFFAAWGQMLNYIITVAISAFFVPHYLGVLLGAAAALARATSSSASASWCCSALLNIVGVQEAAGLNIFLAIADFLDPAAAGGGRASCSCFSPETLVDNVDFGTYPTCERLPDRDPGRRWSPTRASRRSRTWPRRRATTARRSRARWAAVVVAVVAIYAFLPAVALSAMPVVNGETQLGCASRAVRRRPGARRRQEHGPRRAPGRGARSTSAILAATILFIATNAGLIGVSRLTYSMGQYRQLPEKLRQLHPKFRTPYIAIIVFGVVACLTILPGQADFLGTIYAFGAMLSFTIAHLAVITLRLKPARPRAALARCRATSRIRGRRPAAVRGLRRRSAPASAWVVVTVLNIDDARSPASVWLAIGHRDLRRSTGATWA